MQIEASVLKDHLESLCEVTFCNIGETWYEWIDELTVESVIRPDTLYVCNKKSLAAYHRKRLRSNRADVVSTERDDTSPEEPLHLLYITDNDEHITASDSSDMMIFICKTQKTPTELSKILQDYLRKLNDWKLNMDSAMLCGGMYQAILDLSEPIFKNSIVITDYDYKLLAYTKTISIDDETTNRLIDQGHYDKEALHTFKEAHLIDTNCIPIANKYAKKTRMGVGSYEFMDHIYTIDGVFFAHLVMRCNNRPSTRGLERLFDILVESIGHCVAKDWSLRGGSGGRESKFVLSLLENTTLREAELINLCKRYGVPQQGKFRIHLFDIGHDCSTGQVIRDIRKLLGRCWTTMKDDHLVALCANENLSEKQQIFETIELINYLEVHSIRDGVSNLFCNIIEAGPLFRESEIALQYGQFVVSCDTKYAPGDATISFFDSCAIFWALDSRRERETDFVNFLLAHNPIRELLDTEDPKNASEDIRILYYYLHLDCNAALVAQSLYMHRNSIYYRIKKMSENYAIDFDDLSMRVYLRFLLTWMRLEGHLDL